VLVVARGDARLDNRKLKAAGAIFSSVKVAPLRLAELVGAQWVDVCEDRGLI